MTLIWLVVELHLDRQTIFFFFLNNFLTEILNESKFQERGKD